MIFTDIINIILIKWYWFNNNILITGAAGRIGSAIAKEAINNGANLILNDINSEKLQLLKTDLLKIKKAEVLTIAANITNQEEIDLLIEQSFSK